jgi:hypothetical protein
VITILPALTETLVLPISADDVEQRISTGIKDKLFVGVSSRGHFSLSPYLFRPPQFQPILKGTIEGSSRGSVVFLRYELYPATKLLIILVSIILLSAAAVSIAMKANIFYTISALAAIFVIHAVAITNIRLHRDPVRKNLLEVLA